ncbi:ImuA family protein [Acetobacter sp. TBRC 12305]|uniref:ImuA family protein n=1 Tax=Acetobacter garciniae TaxID=2817435 RepID=A0A939HMW5_9PROT|nr:ImuA family protein [Acetobacter garciniae]MBO1324307.1 ImuA family protein [Acetobacter garciniae]MBX0343996.1 ImuA family protein [Acetobacter garciniae]
MSAPRPALEALREQISRLEGHNRLRRPTLPFGVPEIDSRLPGGGLVLGALHEVAGGGSDALHSAAAGQFCAGIAARTRGKVLWIVTRQDVFAPALKQVGLSARRVIYVEAGTDTDVLACFEEGLRHGGLGTVVAEVARLSMTASRRLQLAAETSGVLGIAIRRWRRQSNAADFGQPTASLTRWRVSVLPSVSLPVAGVGRARWRLELIRARAGECADFEVEACDAQGRLAPCRLALSAALADGSDQEEAGQRRARA